MSLVIGKTWTAGKTSIDFTHQNAVYFNENSQYLVYVNLNAVILEMIINQDGGADQTDFETNYKSQFSSSPPPAVATTGSDGTALHYLSTDTSGTAYTLDKYKSNTGSGSITVTGVAGGYTFDVTGYTTVFVSISGTWTGTVNIEGSVDGTNFGPCPAVMNGLGVGGASGWTSNQGLIINCAGFSKILVYVIGLTGTVNVAWQAGTGPNSTLVSALPAVYNGATFPSLGGLQQSLHQLNQFGELCVVSRNKYSNLSGAATTTIKSGFGRLHAIAINVGAAATATVYDNTAGSGTKIATITATTSTNPSSVIFDCEFSTGLTVVTTGSSANFTVTYW